MMDWMEAGSREASGRTWGAEMTEEGGGGKRRFWSVVVVSQEEEVAAVAMVKVRVRERVRVVLRRNEGECISLLSWYCSGRYDG